MRPLHLRIEAFGPYPDSVEIDFRRLADHGLFVVSGATGAGKTSIFDAMTFALFGRLAGHRSGHRAIKSEHASDDQLCTLELEFAIRDERWRVSRQPRQTRTKARGTGTTEVAPTALLERFDGTDWVGTAAKVSEVDSAIRELVGLDADKFQRVVLLPQGQFQEVLLASTDERKKLLRALFGTERFEAVQEEIKKRSAAAREATAEADRRRAQLLNESTDALDAAEAIIEASLLADDDFDGPEPAGPESPIPESADTGPEIRSETVEADTPATPVDLGHRSLALRDGGLVQLSARSVAARADASAAELHRSEAVATNTALDNQATARTALASLIADTDGQNERLARIAAAQRAAAPLVAYRTAAGAAAAASEAAGTAADRWRLAQTMLLNPLCDAQPDSPSEIDGLLARARQQVQRYQAEVETAAARVAALTDATRFQQGAIEARKRATESEERLQQLAAEATEIASKIERSKGAEARLDGLRAQANQSTSRARAARELVEAMESGRTRARVVAELASIIGALDQESSVRAKRRIDLGQVAAELPTRKAARDEASRRSQLHRSLTQLTDGLSNAEHESRAASAEHDRCFATYVAQAAPRLASELHDGEPCSVCGSTDHPNPALLDPTAAAAAVNTDQLAAAQATAASAAQGLATLRASIESHLDQLGTAAKLSSDEAIDQARTAAQSVTEAETAIADLDVIDADDARARVRRQELVAKIDAAKSDLSSDLHEVVRLGGALTELASDDDPKPPPSGSSPDVLVGRYRNALQRATESTVAATNADNDNDNDNDADADADEATHGATDVAAELADIVAATNEVAAALQAQAKSRGTALAEAEQLAHERTALEQRFAQTTAKHSELTEAIASQRETAQKLDGQADQATNHAEHLKRQLTVVDPAASRDAWGRSLDALEQAQRAVAESSIAGDAKAAAESELESVLSGADFASVDALLAAELPASDLEELVQQADTWKAEEAALKERVAHFAAANLPAEKLDVDALERAAQQLAERANAIANDATKAEFQLDRADTALTELAVSDAESESIRQNALEWHQLEQTCSGKNAANIDLESWVLANYLDRVVALANEHLRPMTRGRYQLQISTTGSRVIRRGLDLEAFDRSSGTARPVITLSGGETFMASLALALGLADAVTSTRGGMQLDALFVDEGFGSLDGDTLDAAIEVLDGLRSAGTMVGLITHVPAMKEALPVAIEVEAAPTGGGSVVRQLL